MIYQFVFKRNFYIILYSLCICSSILQYTRLFFLHCYFKINQGLTYILQKKPLLASCSQKNRFEIVEPQILYLTKFDVDFSMSALTEKLVNSRMNKKHHKMQNIHISWTFWKHVFLYTSALFRGNGKCSFIIFSNNYTNTHTNIDNFSHCFWFLFVYWYINLF